MNGCWISIGPLSLTLVHQIQIGMFRNFITFLILLCASASAAMAYDIQAVAVDSVGEPLPYATFRIFPAEGGAPLVSNTTDADGVIRQSLDNPGHYNIVISYVGMSDATEPFEVSDTTPSIQLGKIALSDGATQLRNVTVTAQKPLIVKQIDRLGYDVQADPATPTSTLSDILRKVPMVSVDADGTIKVNGSSDFKIYKNGRPNTSLSRNAKDLFAAMPASMIKRVEVITDPGAAFDAEGTSAILNIVTNDNTQIKGVLGNVRTRYNNLNKYPDANLWLTSEINKVTFSLYGGYNHFEGKMSQSQSWSKTEFPDGTYRDEQSASKAKGDLAYFGVNGSWQIDSLNLFTAELGGYWYSMAPRGSGLYNTYDNLGAKIGSLAYTTANPHNRYFDIDANFNFQHLTHRKGEIYTISYMLSHTNENNKNHSDYFDGFGVNEVPYSAISSDYTLKFIEHTLQFDWTRSLGRHTLDFGAKGIFRRNNSSNTTTYIDWSEMDNSLRFNHLTDVGAIFGQYSVRLGPVSLRAGLRWEYSHLKASYPDGSASSFSANLSDWVPSAAASWQANDANSFTFNYATSINRPGISYLNPAITLGPTSMSFGNADLGSARRQSMKLTYMLIKPKVNFNFSVSYAWMNNGIAPINYLNDDNITVSTYQNTGHRRDVGLNGFVQWTAGPKTRLLFNGGVEYSRMSQQGMTLSRWAPRGFMQLTQQLPWKLSLELMCFYNGPRLIDVYSYSTNSFMSGFHYNLTLRRSFLKENRLTVGLSTMSPIGPKPRFTTRVVNGDYRSTSNTRSNFAHAFSIDVSFRFGSLNAQVKKTARSIDNDDLVGRKSNADSSSSSSQF